MAARRSSLSIVSWNVDGVSKWFARGSELANLVEHRFGAPDILCLQEVRLKHGDEQAIASMTALLPGYSCHYSLSNDPLNVRFRGGRAYGVCTFVRNAHAVVAATPPWDREGRALVTALPDVKLAVVNIYAVNGTSKPYLDPTTGKLDGDRHAWKQRFQDHVMDLGDELAVTEDVVMCGDWNVSLTKLDVTPRLRVEEPHATARARLTQRFERGAWVDVLRAADPDGRHYTWIGKTRGGQLDAARVDYFVTQREMVTRVSDARVLTSKDERVGSDHAPITLSLAAR